jgi:pyruvate dehydrogenase E1 component
MRLQALAGAYRLLDRRGEPDYEPGVNVVHILASGAMVPEAVEASQRLLPEGVQANVVNVTGPGPLYERFQESVRSVTSSGVTMGIMTDVVPPEDRAAPAVTVVDGHPHSLAWVGSALGTATFPLGVSEFGQSGTRPDLYREYGIDVESIMAACFGALEG